MPVDRYASSYNMSHNYRGQAIIFKHVIFDDPELVPLYSSNVDAETLSQTLKKLRFEVRIHKDYTYDQIKTIFENISKTEDHSNNDCILIAILSHGIEGRIYAKDIPYPLDAISRFLTAENCPSLAGKPKLFFIQAERGEQLDGGYMMENRSQMNEKYYKTSNNTDSMMETRSHTVSNGQSFTYYPNKIPNHADFLIAHSTMHGYASWHNNDNGSWFIQTLCKELNKHGTRNDILILLTSVIQKVAFDFESFTLNDPDGNKKKQVPSITYMLTKMLIFTEK